MRAKLAFRLVRELADDGIDVAVACRVLEVSRSGYYEWRDRTVTGPSARDLADAYLANTVVDIHHASRGSYGRPRMHAELRLGAGMTIGHKKVGRLLQLVGRVGTGGNTHRKRRNRPLPAPHDDRVQRKFVADAPNRLRCTDMPPQAGGAPSEHPTGTGKVCCCAVLDVFSRTIVGWSIADHMRSELVVDALQMTAWRRHPEPGAIVHADRGSQYTSWVFGHRLRQAGLLGSMGRVASSVDNTMIESFWSTMQRELLDIRRWSTQERLASAIFEWIEAWYDPRRRNTSLGMLSPHEYEDPSHRRPHRGMITTPAMSGGPGQAPFTMGADGPFGLGEQLAKALGFDGAASAAWQYARARRHVVTSRV